MNLYRRLVLNTSLKVRIHLSRDLWRYMRVCVSAPSLSSRNIGAFTPSLSWDGTGRGRHRKFILLPVPTQKHHILLGDGVMLLTIGRACGRPDR